MVEGFFKTRSDVRTPTRGSRSARVIGSWRDINPEAKSPDMAPTGSARPKLYILGEAPGENEDKKAVQFVGDSGKRLRALLPGSLTDDIRWNNVVRTRPPHNRTPNPAEVEYYRASLVRDIEECRPLAILGVGAVPLGWALPGMQITLVRGRRFPIKVGKHKCWFYPVHHPAWIMRVENGKEANVPGSEWRKAWERDVAAACADVVAENPRPPRVVDDAELAGGLVLATDWPSEKVAKWLGRFHDMDCAFDFETIGFRPYEADARIETISVSNWKESFSFFYKEELADAFLAWLKSKGKRIAHGGSFEQEWLSHCFGGRLLREIPPLEDTQSQAYVLDERGTDDGSDKKRKKGGCHNLDFLCKLHFGLPLKSKSSNVDRRDVGGANRAALLRYNALDSKFTYALYREQALLIKHQGLEAIYQEHIRRIPTAVLTQLHGLAVDQTRVSFFKKKLTTDEADVTAEIGANRDVRRYCARYGKFNPGSAQDVLRILKDLGFSEALRVGEGWSTDDTLLSKVDHDVARGVLRLRKLTKLRGTYVDRMNPAHARSYVYPDGRVHPLFNTLRTVTGRFASADPNAQNFPKRKNAEIRSIVVADKGCVLIALDYGQLEARVIASLSGQLEVALTDIHMNWAERIAQLHPPIFKKRGSDIKAFRADIKNQLVFPLFYGTSAGHVGAMLELPRRIADKVYEEFWAAFPKVRVWQRKLLDSYAAQGYVEGPTGRRRRAPMSPNEIINTPVQGSASDIVVDAMNRLSERAYLQDIPRLQPVLNIHDDLTICAPKRKHDEYLEMLKTEALDTQYGWVRVPMQVEISSGPNWHELALVGKFDNAK